MRQAKNLVLLAMCFSIVSTPVFADSILDSFKNYAGVTVTGWADLEAKRTALETQVTEALKIGKLTASQAADFRAQLKLIADAETAAKAANRRMSFRENLQFTRDIYSISSQIDQAVNNQLASTPDVDTLQTQLQAKISNALASGQVTAQDATTLKAELQHVADMEAAYKAETGGTLTPRQIEVLATELNTVQAHVDQQVKLGESAIPQLTNRRSTIQQRITDATASGKLSAADSAAIKAELDQVAAKQSAFMGTGNILTGSQVLMIASQLDAVEAHLDAKLAAVAISPAGTPPVSPAGVPPVSTAELDLKRAQLDNKIKELIAAGVFSPAIASDYNFELEQMGTLEQAYKASVGGITAAQVQQLASGLDRLNYLIDRQSRMPQGGPGGGYGAAPAPAPQTPSINLPIVSSKDFADVAGYWAQPYVNELASRAVIGGFPDGTFKPNAEITRSQFASIVTHALNLPTTAAGNNFTDVPATHWAAASIAAVANAGLVGGFPDGTFHPEDKLTRAQALVILAKALHSNVAPNSNALDPYSDKQAVPSWASDAIATAAQAHIIANFPDAAQIRPNALATRGEVAALMYQTLSSLGANLPKNKIGVL